MKQAVETYYNNLTEPFKYKVVPVLDPEDRANETKSKVTREQKGVYTLNMYYARCSCLINGK